jgi:hypothetical protein
MKTNHSYHWTIWLYGKKHTFVETFTGTLDEALSQADVLESVVRFQVIRYEVIRGERE